jgi:thiol-disulfide isomerase/thioredoxin
MTMLRFAVVLAFAGCAPASSTPPASAAASKGAEPDAPTKVEAPEPDRRPDPERAADPDPEPEPELERITIVSLDPAAGALDEQLASYAARARKDGKTPYVELWASWCKPCVRVDELLEDPELQAKLGKVALIRVNVDAFNKPLMKAGFKSPTIPAFYEVTPQGRPTKRLLHGHSWKNTATIAEKLPTFLLGSD